MEQSKGETIRQRLTATYKSKSLPVSKLVEESSTAIVRGFPRRSSRMQWYHWLLLVLFAGLLASNQGSNDELESSLSSLEKPKLIIDSISMGNMGEKSQLTLKSQQESWFQALPGSRNFFAATEDICFPECLSNDISSSERNSTCNSHDAPDKPAFWKTLESFHRQSMGWWCAQKRTICGMKEVMANYGSPSSPYPDWLLIVDDDTWMNPHFLPPILEKAVKNDQPLALTPSFGKAVRRGEPSVHYGGAGIAIHREILEAFRMTIDCSSLQPPTTSTTNHSTIQETICERLKIAGYVDGPDPLFKDGTSLLDFMYNMLSRRVSCLHSDWWQGILIWLAGYQTKIFPCKSCPDTKGSRILHSQGKCGPDMLACHRMDYQRMPTMTDLALKCHKSRFARYWDRKCRVLK